MTNGSVPIFRIEVCFTLDSFRFAGLIFIGYKLWARENSCIIFKFPGFVSSNVEYGRIFSENTTLKVFSRTRTDMMFDKTSGV